MCVVEGGYVVFPTTVFLEVMAEGWFGGERCAIGEEENNPITCSHFFSQSTL